LLFTLSDPAGGSKIHGPLLPVTPLLKHLLFPQQVRKSFQAIEDIEIEAAKVRLRTAMVAKIRSN
jgi:hypothetical protein